MANVTKSFGASRALRGVSFALEAGEVHALIGENGAGKSTLMKVLSGAVRPDGGSMTLGGSPVRAEVARETQGPGRRHDLPGTRPGAPPLGRGERHARPGTGPRRASSAAGNTAGSSPTPSGCSTTPRSTRPAGRDAERRRRDSSSRSRGRLVSQARVIIFDEPTSSLSEHDAARLFEVIRRLQSGGIAIVYISHFLEEVRAIAERYTVLRDGEAVASGALARSS